MGGCIRSRLDQRIKRAVSTITQKGYRTAISNQFESLGAKNVAFLNS
ncbi:hypothetical protein COO91_08592 [Nostoc flagelliforme CCNUN1]|uniref:Uncharacterized protein n=1 Tax=Nostoc flagelliforme CCNUN1 TaxID=2038116 RepID=A0A2K8T427_9NOSO|nr:hypothetical protein COO91_08592 [Nostoc flagelliforme CCNUN1]